MSISTLRGIATARDEGGELRCTVGIDFGTRAPAEASELVRIDIDLDDGHPLFGKLRDELVRTFEPFVERVWHVRPIVRQEPRALVILAGEPWRGVNDVGHFVKPPVGPFSLIEDRFFVGVESAELGAPQPEPETAEVGS